MTTMNKEKELKECCETIEWALDLIAMYDKRLVEKGDPEHLVYSDIHKQGVWRARDLLGRLQAITKSEPQDNTRIAYMKAKLENLGFDPSDYGCPSENAD